MAVQTHLGWPSPCWPAPCWPALCWLAPGRPPATGLAGVALHPDREGADPLADPDDHRHLHHPRPRHAGPDPVDSRPLAGLKQRADLADPPPRLLGGPGGHLLRGPGAGQRLGQRLGELPRPAVRPVRRRMPRWPLRCLRSARPWLRAGLPAGGGDRASGPGGGRRLGRLAVVGRGGVGKHHPPHGAVAGWLAARDGIRQRPPGGLMRHRWQRCWQRRPRERGRQ